MIEDTEDHKAAFNDLVNENAILKPICLTKDHWKQLSNIKKVFEPFSKYTDQVSKKLLSIQLTIQMYFELNDTLTKMIQHYSKYASFDNEVIQGLKKGKEKFDKYFDLIKANDIYYIASVLDL
jgi:hypothetical protein